MQENSTSKGSTKRRTKRRAETTSAIQTALREQAREANRPPRQCALCAASGLTRSAAGRIEEHHLGGQHHDANATTPLCDEHHHAVHEAMRDAGASMAPQSTFRESLVQMLRALGTLLVTAGRALLAWAERLWADHLRSVPTHA